MKGEEWKYTVVKFLHYIYSSLILFESRLWEDKNVYYKICILQSLDQPLKKKKK